MKKILILFILVIANVFAMTQSVWAEDVDCNQMYEDCAAQNPYNLWLFPSEHIAFDLGCLTAEQSCLDQQED